MLDAELELRFKEIKKLINANSGEIELVKFLIREDREQNFKQFQEMERRISLLEEELSKKQETNKE